MDKVTFLCLLIGLFAGIVGGGLGLGGGTIIIPALIFFLGFSQHTAQGTSMATLLPPIGLLAVMEYYRKGHVDIKVAVFLCMGFVIGGYIGGYFANILSAQILKKVFGFYLLIISIKFIFDL